MPKTPARSERSAFEAIQEKSKTDCGDTLVNESDEFMIKPQGSKHSKNKIPLDAIIGFLEIKFEAHPTLLSFHLIEVVNNFLSHYYIFGYPFIKDKSSLRRINKLSK